MSWIEHLAELRSRLVRTIVALILSCSVGWYLAPTLLAWLQRPVGQLVFVAPAEVFMAYIQLALATGMVLASPWMLAEVWLFVRPGLLAHEYRILRRRRCGQGIL